MKILLIVSSILMMSFVAKAKPFSRSQFLCEIRFDSTALERHEGAYADLFEAAVDSTGTPVISRFDQVIWYNRGLQELYLGNLALTEDSRMPSPLRAPNYFTNSAFNQIGFVPGEKLGLIFNSGGSIVGHLSHVMVLENQLAYVKFHGPTSLLGNLGAVIPGQGKDYHQEGFSAPVGPVIGFEKPLHLFSEQELIARGIEPGKRLNLRYESGIQVTGVVKEIQTVGNKPLIIQFEDGSARVWIGDQTLFDPSWGAFDLFLAADAPSKVVYQTR